MVEVSQVDAVKCGEDFHFDQALGRPLDLFHVGGYVQILEGVFDLFQRCHELGRLGEVPETLRIDCLQQVHVRAMLRLDCHFFRRLPEPVLEHKLEPLIIRHPLPLVHLQLHRRFFVRFNCAKNLLRFPVATLEEVNVVFADQVAGGRLGEKLHRRDVM